MPKLVLTGSFVCPAGTHCQLICADWPCAMKSRSPRRAAPRNGRFVRLSRLNNWSESSANATRTCGPEEFPEPRSISKRNRPARKTWSTGQASNVLERMTGWSRSLASTLNNSRPDTDKMRL